MSELVNDYRTASDGFLDVARSVTDWSAPTPCTEWDARGIVEHIIGFHDAVVLGPTGREVSRPDDDPVGRWAVTAAAVQDAFGEPGILDLEVDVPGMGRARIGRLAPTFTTDILVHTWDLARASGQDVTLDETLCASAYETAKAYGDGLADSGMFAPAILVPDDAPVQDRLLGLMGRDPNWQPPG